MFARSSAKCLLQRVCTSTASASATATLSSTSSTSCLSRGYISWSTSVNYVNEWTKSEALANWVLDRMKLLQPARVHLCDGSEAENKQMLEQMVHTGTLIKLNSKLRPNSFLARSPPSDVARVEEQTFICSENEDDAGFTNNWKDPESTTTHMNSLFDACMRGRTMYVIPFVMGPVNSPFSVIGAEITDSPYVVANMRIMTRMGKPALDMLASGGEFLPCVHSVGRPVERGVDDPSWPCDTARRQVVHFPEQRRIWSYGSGYGGNALLGKKCVALRIASATAKEEGWLAEHMLIVGITNPQGVKKYFCAAFPSACGKTNLAMMLPKLDGWKVETVGDDISWMRIGPDGRLYAVNPEAGFFGVAPGTSKESNPNAMETMRKNVIFTNVAMTPQGDVWWEGMTDKKPPKLTSWLRHEWDRDSIQDAAHPNARFTVSASQCPVIDPEWENPKGVPISGIIFGGRRSDVVPLVYQAFNWQHGVFLGASMSSETTAAAAGKRGVLRSDPFAMRPFCGYNMGDYFNHWLTFPKRTSPQKLPKFFHVNWFRKSANGKYVWPGFGDNVRVIKWIFDRCDQQETDHSNAQISPIGIIPKQDSLDTKGLNISSQDLKELFRVDPNEWRNEVARTKMFFTNFKARLPQPITDELNSLSARLDAAEKKL